MVDVETLNPVQSRKVLWDLGVIAPWYLRPSQLDIYDLLVQEKNPFVEAARRFGKTTTTLVHVMERLLQNPGWICRWCEPWKEQAREIVMPELEKIQSHAAPSRKFQYQVSGSVYVLPNKSRLYLRGVNEDRGESARGPAANIVVGDEFGSWRDPEYTANEVLRPQLLTTRGQFIFTGSPAEDLAHLYYEYKDRAIRENRFIQKTVYDNESLTKDQISEIVLEVGGEQKPAWLREYLCQPVSDPESLVVPEYNDRIHDVDDDYPYPECFDTYVGLDLGFNDCTAALFAYWDFLNQELVIDDEYVGNAKNTKQITDSCKAKEAEIWKFKDGKPMPVYRRISDNELQQIYDMNTLFGYAIWPTEKHDKLAWINRLRLRFGSAKIKIKKRCKSLRYQLKVGLWNDRKTDFKRGSKTGHLDAVSALIYLSRNIDEQKNPYPKYGGASIHTHFIPDPISQGTQRSLKEVFEFHPGSLGHVK